MAGALAATGGVLWFAGRSGGTLPSPYAGHVWEISVTIVAAVILGTGVVQSIRARRLSRVLLTAVAAGTAFWQETYGDWGTYLLYSPTFIRYYWGETIWTSPVRCWWFIAGYVFFYTTFFVALERAFYVVKKRWPEANPYILTTVASFPMFYVFDLMLEGAAHGFGWWQYQYAFGPTVSVGHGHFPLLWPIVEQVPFMMLAVWAVTWRSDHGEDVFELVAHKTLRREPGQTAVLTSWIVLLNASFLLTTILPLMALRWIAGSAGAVMP